ncbi:hypothetical protein SLEP1_g49673 [Rubroshorea leprosula]|uniref:Uncharacterized protein n=1 Tax=Rubroshorea leprosula TaxID=152421 RepID=A0AAV5LXI9_9ROSI|nr:hypothetical protein SLEP1_g49673 [Rubroshorea leprosula]
MNGTLMDPLRDFSEIVNDSLMVRSYNMEEIECEGEREGEAISRFCSSLSSPCSRTRSKPDSTHPLRKPFLFLPCPPAAMCVCDFWAFFRNCRRLLLLASSGLLAGILGLLWLKALGLSPQFMRVNFYVMRLRKRSQGRGKTREVTS